MTFLMITSLNNHVRIVEFAQSRRSVAKQTSLILIRESRTNIFVLHAAIYLTFFFFFFSYCHLYYFGVNSFHLYTHTPKCLSLLRVRF